MPRLADHPDGIRPLLSGGRRVVVDAEPICAACGRAVMPTGPYRWRHVPSGRRSPRRSRWLSPVTLDDARRVATYADFVARFPAVAQTTTEADWRAGLSSSSIMRRRWPPPAGAEGGVAVRTRTWI